MKDEIRLLKKADQPAVLEHLLGLSSDDRYSRFRRVMTDEAISTYASSIDFKRHVGVGYFADDQLIGLAMMTLYICKEGYLTGELSVSVLEDYRRLGAATAVMSFCEDYASGEGVATYHVLTTKSNRAMLSLASKFGKIAVEEGEAECRIDLLVRKEKYRLVSQAIDGIDVWVQPDFSFKNLKHHSKVAFLLHGAGASPWQWRQYIVSEMIKDGIHPVLLDLQFGRSMSWSAGAQIPAKLAGIIEEALSGEGHQILICGHSAGGMLAELTSTHLKTPHSISLVCALDAGNVANSIQVAIEHVDSSAKDDLLALASSFDAGRTIEATDINPTRTNTSVVSALKDQVSPMCSQEAIARRHKVALLKVEHGHNALTGSQWRLIYGRIRRSLTTHHPHPTSNF